MFDTSSTSLQQGRCGHAASCEGGDGKWTMMEEGNSKTKTPRALSTIKQTQLPGDIYASIKNTIQLE